MTFGAYEVGKAYNRRKDLHGRFGGQMQGGISTPASQPAIFLFTGKSGTQHGYADGWAPDGTYRYFGEGQVGDMVWKAGNASVRDHSANGKDLLLFETMGKGAVRFLGAFVFDGFEVEKAPDSTGALREAFVFRLVPQDNFEEPRRSASAPVDLEDLLKLRQLARSAVKPSPPSKPNKKLRNCYERDDDIRAYVLARAGGVCEVCAGAAPFKTPEGSPFLEPHHIRRVSDGGPDDPVFMGAVCPNCHREIHHGARGKEVNESLQVKVYERERTLRSHAESLGLTALGD